MFFGRYMYTKGRKNMNNKKGLSLVVLVVFSFVIVSTLVTVGLQIFKLTSTKVEEENGLKRITESPLMDFYVCYKKVDNKAVIRITDNSANIVMFTLLKVENGITPNVGAAEWSYNIQFEVTESGEYLVYGKDVNGNISDSVVLSIEL